jgi:hypothetical protein
MPNLVLTHKDLQSILTKKDLNAELARKLVVMSASLDPDTKNRYLRGDTTVLTEIAALLFEKGIADTYAVGDIDPDFVFGKGLSDSVAMQESLTTLLIFLRDFSDTTLLTETSISHIDKEVADTLSLSEASTLGVTLAKTDTVTLTEDPDLSFGKAATDSVSLSESLTRTVSFVRVFTDAFSLDDAATVDAFVKDEDLNKTNVFSFADFPALGFSKQITPDTFTVSDVDAIAFGKNAADSFSFTDNFSYLIFSNAAMNAAQLNSTPFNE